MSLRNSPSTHELASCCQPRRVVPGHGRWTGASCQSVPRRRIDPQSASQLYFALRCNFQERGRWFSAELPPTSLPPGCAAAESSACSRPNWPRRPTAPSNCAPQPKTSQSDWHGCRVPHVLWLFGLNLCKCTGTPPH